MTNSPHTSPVALITGAGRGIGRAVAVQLAASGWRVIATDICRPFPGLDYPLATPEDLAATVRACGQDAAIGLAADVTDRAELASAMTQGVERFGPLTAAVAVAGAMAGGQRSWEAPDTQLETMLDINLRGVWNTLRVAIPSILSSDPPSRGRVVAVASTGAVSGLPLLAAYCASKAAVAATIRCLAAELAPYGVTANAVCPGSTEGAMLDRSAEVYGLATSAEFAHHHMLPRLLQPDEPAALITWLCSEAAGGLTGATIPVDAGMTAR